VAPEPFDEVVAICRSFGLDPDAVPRPFGRPLIRMPFLHVHGRTDATISYMGANIYPEDVEQRAARGPGHGRAAGLPSALEVRDRADGAVRPCVHVERLDGVTDDAELAETLRRRIVHRLATNSRDFHAALGEDPLVGRHRRRVPPAGYRAVRGERPTGSSAATSSRRIDRLRLPAE
jgi:phenylacetate-CoA ligase